MNDDMFELFARTLGGVRAAEADEEERRRGTLTAAVARGAALRARMAAQYGDPAVLAGRMMPDGRVSSRVMGRASLSVWP